jgi:hypothetical protein
MLKDAGGTRCNKDYSVLEDGCHGDGTLPWAVDPNKHGQLTKEYHSTAACEGIADFYAAITWNSHGLGAPCEYSRGYLLDWNIDGTTDVAGNDPHACFGDPFADNPNLVTDGDWLEDVIAAGYCTGPLANRSSQYDWLRFAWDMVTVQGVPMSDFWNIWDEADPWDWNEADVGAAADMPNARMEAAAATAPDYSTEYSDAAAHGLDH